MGKGCVLRRALAHDPASYYPCNTCPANLGCPSAGAVVGKSNSPEAPLPEMASQANLLQLDSLASAGAATATTALERG